VDIYQDLDKFYPTGNGVDFCIHLARLGIPASIVSVVGTDVYGSEMLKTLNQEGINTSHLHILDGDTCKMIMGMKENDRVHLKEIEGVMASFSLSEDDKNFIYQHDYLHTDLFGNILHSLPEFKNNNIKIIMDFSVFFDDPKFRASESFPYVDFFFGSYQRKDVYIQEFMQRTWELGPKLVTITLGENGSISYDGSKFYEYGIFPVQVVNTVGAGDSYIAGFMYGVINNWSISECMKSGAELAAKVISKFEPY
jgi:fructoselysine 6-kinase